MMPLWYATSSISAATSILSGFIMISFVCDTARATYHRHECFSLYACNKALTILLKTKLTGVIHNNFTGRTYHVYFRLLSVGLY
ncbi:hypothetical protein BC830DRAFT_1113628 [Chytriomyces sp. MP71]|nr:hypothetical protein BC830DRAFT_1113628 [Chytriomyces sp. MP71]